MYTAIIRSIKRSCFRPFKHWGMKRMSDISYNRRVHYYIALYELFQEQECLHCMDIARKLSISLPAASRMLQKLISEGLIEKKSYQSI